MLTGWFDFHFFKKFQKKAQKTKTAEQRRALNTKSSGEAVLNSDVTRKEGNGVKTKVVADEVGKTKGIKGDGNLVGGKRERNV